MLNASRPSRLMRTQSLYPKMDSNISIRWNIKTDHLFVSRFSFCSASKAYFSQGLQELLALMTINISV